VICLVVSFFDASWIFLPLIPSTLSHVVAIILQRQARNPLPLTFNSLKMNFSAHVIVINLLFYFVGGPNAIWIIVLGISSFCQVLWYLAEVLVPRLSPSAWTERATQLYRYIKNTKAAEQAMALFEIGNMIMIGRYGFLRTLLRSQGYFLVYVLYRYATDWVHQRVWASYRQSFTGLVMKLPAAVSGLLMKIPAWFDSFGTMALNLYNGQAT
jgi:hypothetical protein